MPITKAEAQGVTRAFVRDYPGALELAYKFREDAAELYGPRAAEVPADMKGGYVPKETLHAGRAYRGRVDVPLQNVESAGDLLMTLRHEVLGHYGANTFAPGEKRALLTLEQRYFTDWQVYRALAQGKSSWYDFNLDGLTDTADLVIVQQNLGTQCPNKQRWEFPRSVD